MNYSSNKNELNQNGFSIIPNVYKDSEIESIIACINSISPNNSSVLKSQGLFAIRQLLNVSPELKSLLFTDNLRDIIKSVGGDDYFITKAIYFDKPIESNWYVPYHQDISISVNEKVELPDYKNWTFKRGQHGVQPPLEILENIFTIRIHLDDTNEENGAVKVIPKSHLKGIYRPETIDWAVETEMYCNVNRGGVMLMKPLTLHASNRTTNNKQRRVIHLEFSNKELIGPLCWLEKSCL